MQGGTVENTITTSGTSLVIKNLEVQDSQLVAAAKAAEAAGQDLTEFATQALKVGATVLSFANAGAGVEKLDHSIEAAKRAMEQAGQQTSKQLQEFVARIAGDDGTLQEIMARRIEEFRVRLESITADEQSPLRRGVQTQLNEAIRLLTERVTLDLQNQKREIGELLKPESPTSPLQVFAERMERIEGSVGHIQTMMDQAVGRDLESAQGTQKGLSYERQVWDVVAEIAAQMGDDSRETGGTPGFIKNNRKGDGVVTFRETNAVASLVVEMKDVKMEGKSTDKRREYWRDLSKESRENRGAVGFLGLCKKIENMPQQYRLVALDNSMTNWVLAFDPDSSWR